MNILEPCTITSPHGDATKCAMFVVDDASDPFIMSGTSTVGQTYTFSFWLQATTGSLTVGNKTFTSIENEWTHCSVTFEATEPDLSLKFDSVGTYYIYQAQLEIGNMVTDWSPNPDDVEASVDEVAKDAQTQIAACASAIEILRDQIRMAVVDENGETMMTQNGDGWSFQFNHHIGNLQSSFSDAVTGLNNQYLSTAEIVDRLNSEFSDMSNYVKIAEYDDGEVSKPCIELGGNVTQDGETSLFKLRITNTSVIFFEDETTKTEIDKDGITTNNLTLRGEFAHNNPAAEEGSGVFVWAMRPNGNYGLTWKELVSE